MVGDQAADSKAAEEDLIVNTFLIQYSWMRRLSDVFSVQQWSDFYPDYWLEMAVTCSEEEEDMQN